MGRLKATYDYDTYGKAHCTIPLSSGGCDASTPFGYTGQYQDAESGLLYERARYYDPSTQQFITRDPLEGQSGQPYAYAFGNPVTYTDPTGQAGSDFPVEQSNGTWEQPTLPGFSDLFRAVGQGINSIGAEGGLSQGLVPIGDRASGRSRPKYDKSNGRGVYVGKDGEGTVRYIGQGDALDRIKNHKLEPRFADLTWEIVADNNLTKAEARGLEQLLIDSYGGIGGGQLRNKDNGAGPRNQNTQSYLIAGQPLFNEAVSIIQNGP